MTMDEVDGVAEVPCMTVDEVDCMVEVPVSIPSSVHGFLPLRGSVLDFLLGGSSTLNTLSFNISHFIMQVRCGFGKE